MHSLPTVNYKQIISNKIRHITSKRTFIWLLSGTTSHSFWGVVLRALLIHQLGLKAAISFPQKMVHRSCNATSQPTPTIPRSRYVFISKNFAIVWPNLFRLSGFYIFTEVIYYNVSNQHLPLPSSQAALQLMNSSKQRWHCSTAVASEVHVYGLHACLMHAFFSVTVQLRSGWVVIQLTKPTVSKLQV